MEVDLKKAKLDLRERAQKIGTSSLQDAELIALLLRTGTSNQSLMDLAHQVSEGMETGRPEAIYERLCALEGMGPTKATTIMAAMELGKRYAGCQQKRIQKAADVYPLLQHFADRKQEQFLCVSLNGAHEVIAVRVVSIGILNRTIVHPREVFGDPISDRAASIIVAHNHPSGQLTPSEEDRNITQRLKEAGELLGIQLLDHLIISPKGEYFSFAEQGILYGNL